MQHISEQKPSAQALRPTLAGSTLAGSTLAGSSLLVSGLAILALMSGWGMFLYLGIGSLVWLERPPKQIPVNSGADDEFHEQRHENAQPTEEETQQQTAEYKDIEAALVLRLQRAELTARIEELELQIRQTEDAANRLAARMASLRISDLGRSLASFDSARRFVFLSSYPKEFNPDALREIVTGWKETIEAARQPLGDMNYFHATLTGIQSDLESSQSELEIVSSAIGQLLRENTVAQPITLQDAIDRLTSTDTAAVQQAVDARLQKERDVQAAQLKTETDRKAVLERDVQAAKSKLADAEKQARQQIDSANRAAEEAKQAREAELTQAIAQMKAAYPAVRELLAPFTTPGYRKISSTTRFETSADKEPLSYSGLLRRGVLEDSARGIEGLFYLVQPHDAFGNNNDRPLGEFPEYKSFNDIENATTREKVKQAQAFIRLYGNAMVKTGLLSE
ncbi:hypothetical protein GC176_02120 [bacterium]|nr:hypothetical protein [bacterium]